jgi:hypothetical protein
MNRNKAILVCNNYLKCSEAVSFEELDTSLFKEALQYLITLAQEQSELLSK